MSLQIGDAVSGGLEKLTTTAGLQLAALYIVVTLLSTLGINSAVAEMAPEATGAAGSIALTLPLGVAGGVVLFVLGAILGIVLNVVILRTVAHDASELTRIPADVTRSLPKTVVFLLITGIIVFLSVLLGFIFLVIPGIFLMVSLVFSQVYVAVEDMGPIEALSASWELSKGNRLSIFLLGVLVFVIGFVVGMVGSVTSIVSPAAGTVVSVLISGVINIFSSAVLVEAFLQLSNGSNSEGGHEDPTATPAL